MSSSSNDAELSISINYDKWILTEYDAVRGKHETVFDDSEIIVSPRSLNAELMCPICLDMLKNTMTTKECLHRFCQECITTALRSGNKECPTCRKKLVSKRSLRADPNMDKLIAKLYPNREEYEKMQERAMQNLSKHHSTEALQKSIEEGMKLQAELRKIHRMPVSSFDCNSEKNKKRKKEMTGVCQSPSDVDLSVSSENKSSATTSFCRGKVTEIEFILRPHPNMDMSSDVSPVAKQTRYLNTTANATVDHLAQFLIKRIKLDTDEARRSASNGSFSTLNDQGFESPSKNDENMCPTDSTKIKHHAIPVGGLIIETNGECQPKENVSTCKLYVMRGGGAPYPTTANNSLPNNLTELCGESTLDFVLTKMWCIKKPLEMYFYLVDETVSGQQSVTSKPALDSIDH